MSAIHLNPWYRTTKCTHDELRAKGCETCGLWDVRADLGGVPRVGDLVSVHREYMSGAGFPDNGDESDDYLVTEVAWSTGDLPSVELDPVDRRTVSGT